MFSQAGCHSCRPTNSVKALKEKRQKCRIPRTCSPQAHLWVFQICSWPLKAPGYLGGGLPCLSSAWLPCLSSALYCQYPNFITPIPTSSRKKIPPTTVGICQSTLNEYASLIIKVGVLDTKVSCVLPKQVARHYLFLSLEAHQLQQYSKCIFISTFLCIPHGSPT